MLLAAGLGALFALGGGAGGRGDGVGRVQRYGGRTWPRATEAAPAPSWTPAELEHLSSWHRADLGVTLNGSRVSAWADQSGNGHTLTQGTAGQQPLVAAAAVGGQTALTFAPGRQDNLAFAGGFNQGSGASRAYAVLHSRTQASYSLVVNSAGSGLSLYKGFFGQANKPTVYQNSISNSHADAFTGDHMITWRAGIEATDSVLAVTVDDGVEDFANNGDFLAGTWTTVGTTVGGFEPDMDLAELILCDHTAYPAVSAEEHALLLTYFSERYGIW